MAITSATGVDGDVTLPSGKSVKSDTWSLSVGQALIPTTGFGDTSETNVGGLKRGSFSITGTMQYDAANTNPGITAISKLPESFVFQVATNCTFTFNGIIAQAGASSDVAAGARASYSGATSGDVVTAWDEGA